MIRKPDGDWSGGTTPLTETLERTAAVARQGRQVAASGVRVAGTGLRTFQGLVCWGFALLWGGVALGMLAFGQFPSAIGIGLLALAAASGGKRSFSPATSTAGYATPTPEVLRAGAREVRYSRSALLVALVAGLGLAGLAGHMIARTHGFATFLLGIALVAGPILAVLCAIRLAGDPVALRWDARSITVATLWKRRTLAWSEVSAVTLSRVTSYAWGVVPIGRRTTLGLKLRCGRSIGMTPRPPALGGRSADHLAAELDRCRRGRETIDLPDQDEFDPDAIMARYLAERPAFGLPTEASRVALPSARQSFGRKVA